MIGVFGSLRLIVEHNVGQVTGLTPSSQDLIFRISRSLGAFAALEDGREITHGVQTDARGILLPIGHSECPKEPDLDAPWDSVLRVVRRRGYVIELLMETGKIALRAERVAQSTLQYYRDAIAGRASIEPYEAATDLVFVQAMSTEIGPSLKFSSRLRNSLIRLALEWGCEKWGISICKARWEAFRAGATRLFHGETLGGAEGESLTRSAISAESFNVKSIKNGWGCPRVCCADEAWIQQMNCVFDQIRLQEITQLCTRATILLEERVKLGVALPFSALRSAMQGGLLSASQTQTLNKWIFQVQRDRANEERLSPFIEVLRELFAIEGPAWRTRALLAEVFGSSEIPLAETLALQISLEDEEEPSTLFQEQLTRDVGIYRPRTNSQREGGPFYVFPRCQQIDRCRWLIRQSGRSDDYPRPSEWTPLGAGCWKSRGRLTPFASFRELIQRPATIDQILASEAFLTQVEIWRSGHSLPHVFNPDEIFCERTEGSSRLVWLTPHGPVPYSGKAWEALVQQIFDWMGEEAYLNMTARLGWGHSRDTELLRHLTGSLKTAEKRVPEILAELRPTMPAAWANWIQSSLPQIKQFLTEGIEEGTRRLHELYIDLAIPGYQQELVQRLVSAAMEQIRLFGPAVSFLPRAFKRAVPAVARALQAELLNPLTAIQPLLHALCRGVQVESWEFQRLCDDCGVVCEADTRGVRQLCVVISCLDPEIRIPVVRCLTEGVQQLLIAPDRFGDLIQGIGVPIEGELVSLIQRQVSLLSRHGLTQPNETAIAARRWEASE